MSVIGTYKTLRELRRDRRYPVPVLSVTIGQNTYTTSNWSMGGLLLSGFRGVMAPGAMVSGTVKVEPSGQNLSFRGCVARSMPNAAKLAIRFTTFDPQMVAELDRGMSRRLRR